MAAEETPNSNNVNNNREKRANFNDATMETENHATFHQEQPRPTFTSSAAGADRADASPPHRALNDYNFHITGPPPQRAFANQNNNNNSSSALTNDETPGPAPPTPATSSSPHGSGSHPRLNEPTPWQQPGNSSPSRPAELTDHDYTTRRPHPLTDHDYFMSVPLPDPDPRVNPPPGFAPGRPTRNRQIPTRFSDYELYAIQCY